MSGKHSMEKDERKSTEKSRSYYQEPKKEKTKNKEKKQGKKKRKWLKVLGIILLVIILILGILIGAGYVYITDKLGKMNTVELDESQLGITAEASTKLAKYRNVAIFGVDSRTDDYGQGNRSDCIIIASINNESKEVRLVSVYRDTYVNIQGHGLDKITHAYSYGEAPLAINTLNTNLDLNISEFVTVNFDSVSDAVDELGGVTINIENEEVKYINDYIDATAQITHKTANHITSAGKQTLDGVQAVAYSRIRYTAGGDYKRAERQRTVLFKVFESAKEMNTTAKIKMVSDLIGHVNTNYDTDEILSVFKNLADYTVEDSTAYPQVFYGGKVDGAWVEVPTTLADMATGVHQFLDGDTGYAPSETVNEYSSALSAKVSGPNNDLTNTDFGD